MIFQTYFVSKFFGIGDVWMIFKQNTFQIKSHIKTFLYLVVKASSLSNFDLLLGHSVFWKHPNHGWMLLAKMLIKYQIDLFILIVSPIDNYNIELIVSPTKFSIVCSWTNLTWSWKFIFHWTRNTYGIWGLGIIVPE